MKQKWNQIFRKVMAVIMIMLAAVMILSGCSGSSSVEAKSKKETTQAQDVKESQILEDGEYYTKDDVAEYLYLYGHLPDNYITKNEAKELGWISSKGNLWDVAPGKCIGGDTFGNREEKLPEKKKRKYYECDVNYEGGYRNEDRLIYSNDGLIYFTEDHYESFELLYGEES